MSGPMFQWGRRARRSSLLALLVPVWAMAAEGGLPGTGDLAFDPASDTENNSCIAPFPVNDLNEWYGLSEEVIGPAFCASPPLSGHFVVNAGEFSMPVLRYIALDEEGVEEALAKIVSVRMVVDDRREWVYPAEDVLLLLANPVGFPTGTIQVTYLPKLPPQSVGMHTLRYYWTVSSELCRQTDPSLCYPTGESLFAALQFEVVRGASQSE